MVSKHIVTAKIEKNEDEEEPVYTGARVRTRYNELCIDPREFDFGSRVAAAGLLLGDCTNIGQEIGWLFERIKILEFENKVLSSALELGVNGR